MLGAIATKVGPMSLARNSQRCASTTRGLPTAQENADSRAGKICGHSVAQHRLAWRAVQWRAWLGEARRTGRGLVAGRPCVDPLKRGDQCCEYCDDYRNSEKYDGGTVAIRLVTHEGASTPR